jgi:hypothetical protein
MLDEAEPYGIRQPSAMVLVSLGGGDWPALLEQLRCHPREGSLRLAHELIDDILPDQQRLQGRLRTSLAHVHHQENVCSSESRHGCTSARRSFVLPVEGVSMVVLPYTEACWLWSLREARNPPRPKTARVGGCLTRPPPKIVMYEKVIAVC